MGKYTIDRYEDNEKKYFEFPTLLPNFQFCDLNLGFLKLSRLISVDVTGAYAEFLFACSILPFSASWITCTYFRSCC